MQRICHDCICVSDSLKLPQMCQKAKVVYIHELLLTGRVLACEELSSADVVDRDNCK